MLKQGYTPYSFSNIPAVIIAYYDFSGEWTSSVRRRKYADECRIIGTKNLFYLWSFE